MRSLILLLIGFFAASALAQTPAQLYPRNHGFEAFIPRSVCQSKFANTKWISRPLAGTNGFQLFSFSSRAFDPRRPSILFVQGGPGALWGPDFSQTTGDMFPGYNAVFFHYRGAGCSTLPSLNQNYDSALTAQHVVADMDAIRGAFGVSRWAAVIGFSYGTYVARSYAHSFPQTVGLLVLEGLEANVLPDSRNEISVVLSDLEVLRQTSSSSVARLSASEYQNFMSQYSAMLNFAPPSEQYGLASAWPLLRPQIAMNFSQSTGRALPAHFNRQTFIATTALIYSGSGQHSKDAATVLLSEFRAGHVEATELQRAMNNLHELDVNLYPFLHTDYLMTPDFGLVSMRVQLAMLENDKHDSPDEMCTDRPTIVINGTSDLATPSSGVANYLGNKSCARGPSTALLVRGGGHSNLGHVACLSGYLNQALAGHAPASLQNCSMPVDIQRF